ncbi:MAG: 30S ribosomal protein S21 [Nitrospirae bacterium RBG_13_39_12]|nr:MAG: 30S ribosomal protein S21 [Nitrospirae bacterium RBG_13_39_12]
MEIRVSGNDVERALKILKRELQKDGLFKEIKQRGYYEKPSVKEKRKQREARKKRSKALRFKKPSQLVKK